MGTILDKLNYLISTKNAIKNAINSKGGNVADSDKFRDYADKINTLKTEDTAILKGLVDDSCANIVIPDGTTKIRGYCFYRYTTPVAITVPSSVTTLDSLCFSSCTGLTSITLPNTITNIPSQAFSQCSNLTSIEIPDSITTMDYGAFMGCSKLANIKLSKNLTILPMQAFSQCSSITSLELPNKLTTIENSVFAYGCYSLRSLSIPASVTSIASSAFGSCGIRTLYIDKPKNGISGYPWGASSLTVYWNDGTTTTPSLDDLFG